MPCSYRTAANGASRSKLFGAQQVISELTAFLARTAAQRSVLSRSTSQTMGKWTLPFHYSAEWVVLH
ncbi:hypothetical protein BC938DRAFT_483608 [Jimgerdemannia flammicorona]|uniref:Uncharacterized protein n=1 Tax=Jimgerdemannia flammicorona TaxID=994334 RepID=A0A433QBL1_9FUNG|nr:hypothetical protein BC938DRAFT_483608 [Jimgerdemannia flammicorona]